MGEVTAIRGRRVITPDGERAATVLVRDGLITRTVENGGQLFNLNPALIGWLPTAVIGICTLVAISRTR